MAGGKVWGLYSYEIANEGEINIQLVPRHARKLSTTDYINRLRPVVAKIPVPGGRAMVMQTKIKGLRKLGEADIEVKIKGQEIEKLFDLARQTGEAMNQLAHFTNVYVSMDMTKPEYQIRGGPGARRRTGGFGHRCGNDHQIPGERRRRHPLPRGRRILQRPRDDT